MTKRFTPTRTAYWWRDAAPRKKSKFPPDRVNLHEEDYKKGGRVVSKTAFSESERLLHSQLFSMISFDVPNEKSILAILRDENLADDLKNVINVPYRDQRGGETLLMWAVRRMKRRVVDELIQKGANVQFVNEQGNGAHTSFLLHKEMTDNDQDMCLEIAIAIYNAGADLALGSKYCRPLMQRAAQFKILRDGLRELGYSTSRV